MSYQSPEKRRAEREAQLYEETMGKPPPPAVDDWQLNYRGTKEERARLATWLGIESDEEDRGPQPEQEESLFG